MFPGALRAGNKNDSEFRVPAMRRYAVRFFGKFLSNHINQESMERNLRRAKMGMSGVEFYSEATLYSIIFGVILVAMDTIFLHGFFHGFSSFHLSCQVLNFGTEGSIIVC